MPSIISAGTTANTGLNLTADTSGNLVFQTNGNTTAMTIDTSQNVTYANGVSFTGVIGGNGANISSMNASNLTSGTVANARTTAASANGASTIVLRDSNGSFAGNAGTFTNLSVGNATPTTSGAGITFPATQSASSDANTLDDYEEGTWTPDLRFGNATTGITYSNRGGRYTKVGNAVYFSVRITLSNRGSATGAAQIYGLPFTVGNSGNWADYAGATLAYSDATSGWNVTLQMTLDQGQTYIVFRYNNGTNNVGFTQANFSNSTDVILSGFYFA